MLSFLHIARHVVSHFLKSYVHQDAILNLSRGMNHGLSARVLAGILPKQIQGQEIGRQKARYSGLVWSGENLKNWIKILGVESFDTALWAR